MSPNRACKHIFFFFPYPHGAAPSQRFRFEQYLDHIKQNGHTIHLYPFLDNATWSVLYQKGKYFFKMVKMIGAAFKRFVHLFKPNSNASIFIHRELASFGPPLFEFVLAKVLKRKFIYDFDDAIWLPNYSASNARVQWVKCYWKVKYIIRWADTVTVGNAFLADYARQFNDNVIIIPTTIDTTNHHNELIDYQNGSLVIGWTGSHSTMHYLDEIVPVLSKLEKEISFAFHVISDVAPSYALNSLRFVKWSKETEIDDLRQFSIGIMPLIDDQWSRGKCGFKALQYMSLGIPCVIAPVGVNNEIISSGENGFIYHSLNEFEQQIRTLLLDTNLRREIGLKGYSTLLDSYSVNANAQKYLSLFE